MSNQKAMKTAILLLVFAFAGTATSGQSRQGQIGHSAQGSLTVTVVVESSVGLIASPNGKQQLVVANAPDSKETFSGQAPLKKDSRASVVYSFPGKPVHFDVTRETQLTNVTSGKAVYPPVTVVTVVPR